MTFWDVVAAAAAIVAIATVAGLALQRGVTIGLREQLGDARGKIAEQRQEIDELKEDRQKDRATIAGQANDIRVLQSVVTGEVQWQAISELLDFHHQTTEAAAARINTTLGKILDELRRAS